MIQAGGTYSICDFLFVFQRAVDLRMKIAMHTFISIKDVCLHRTPFSHLLITRKKIPPSGGNTICQNGQVNVTKIIAANIIFHNILQLVLSRRRCLIWMIIRSSDSTTSFGIAVKVPAYHPSHPGSVPAKAFFTARQDCFTHFEPNQ